MSIAPLRPNRFQPNIGFSRGAHLELKCHSQDNMVGFFSVCENAAGSRVNAKSYMAPINLLHYKTTKHLRNLTFSGCFCHFLKQK